MRHRSAYGLPAGLCEAADRFGRMALEELIKPAAALARDGVKLNVQQAYVVEILADILTSTPECAALFAPEGRVLGAGETLRQPELADALVRLGSEGAAPFYTGDIGTAIVDWVTARGGTSPPRIWLRTPSSTANRCAPLTAGARS